MQLLLRAKGPGVKVLLVGTSPDHHWRQFQELTEVKDASWVVSPRVPFVHKVFCIRKEPSCLIW